MVCRHGPNDPECSSSPAGRERERQEAAARAARDEISRRYHSDPQGLLAEMNKLRRDMESMTPDPKNFDIEDVQQIGNHLVIKVRFPSCSKCAYEGRKVMVYLNTPWKDSIRWKELDPHFRQPLSAVVKPPHIAPPPVARFPASNEGWADAMEYARSKNI